MDHASWAEGLVKRSGATTALAGVDLAVPAGTVLGVLGPDGAGTTTAVRILTPCCDRTPAGPPSGGLDVVGRAADVRRLIGVTGQYAAVSILADAVRGLLDGQWPGPVGQSLASAVGITAVFAPLSVWRLRRRI